MSTVTTSKKYTSSTIRLNRYAGKWVAFLGERVIAFAETLEELEGKVKKLKAEKKSVYFLVPRKDEGPYILSIKKYEERVCISKKG